MLTRTQELKDRTFKNMLRQSIKGVYFASLFLPIYFLSYGILCELGIPMSSGFHWLVISLVLFISFLVFDSFRPQFEFWIDQTFFPERLDYKKLLEDAERELAKVKSSRRLFSLVVHFATMRLNLENAAVLAKDKQGVFRLAYRRGYRSEEESALSLDERNPLIHFLQKEKAPLKLKVVDAALNDSMSNVNFSQGPFPFELIRREMLRLRAVSVIPSFFGEELKAILLLGNRKNGEKISDDDLNVLFHLAKDTAVAVENARLYDEALEKGKLLEKINQELHESSRKLARALNETEDANKSLQETQAQILLEQKMVTLGRLASSVGHEINNPLTILSMNISRVILKYRKNPDLKVAEILDSFSRIEKNIERIKAVVNTLTGLLRKHEKGKMEPLSLKLVIEETLPLVRFQTYMDNLAGTEVEFDIPSDLPLVRGDLERLQEVFLNLFINSLHALQGGRQRKISVKAKCDSENPKMIVILFSDNGVGMNEDVMKKIFSFRFTTKQNGKGSGIGLYMSKYIIELHGGDIKVQSRLGHGTTFRITLPACEEMEYAEIAHRG